MLQQRGGERKGVVRLGVEDGVPAEGTHWHTVRK